MKTCDDSACSGESYGAEYTTPSGSDISGESANDYVQFKINFETTDINYAPSVYTSGGYLLKMEYAKQGSSDESDFLSIWEGGFENFNEEGYEKLIKKIEVFYTGTTGTLTVNYKNLESTVDNNIVINLSIIPPFEEENGNKYKGVNDEKVYVYYAPTNLSTEGSPIGKYFKFAVSNTGVTSWNVSKIVVQFTTQPLSE
jgi:hypothetical protein